VLVGQRDLAHGAWIGSPPWLRINSATSADRRLSKLTTRSPLMEEILSPPGG
jgi:hypothetical protein